MKPRRSNLSVPGHLQKMHVKAQDSQADVIMLDLEDSVPLDAKEGPAHRSSSPCSDSTGPAKQ